jgi:hypothetical protein
MLDIQVIPSDTQPGLYQIHMRGTFEESDPICKAALELAERTGATRMYECLKNACERRETIKENLPNYTDI